MRQAAAFFSVEDERRIVEAVRAAERRTAAEFVPAVAWASSRYEGAEDLAGAALAVAAACVSWLAFGALAAEWLGGAPWWPGPLAAGIGALGGYLAGVALGRWWPRLRLLFTTRRTRGAAVRARARQVFEDQRLFRTTGGTGVLIYASLAERMAAVAADRRVDEVMGPQGLDEARAVLEKGLTEGRAGDAMRQAIALAADKLAGPFPPWEDDVNELPDDLVVVEDL